MSNICGSLYSLLGALYSLLGSFYSHLGALYNLFGLGTVCRGFVFGMVVIYMLHDFAVCFVRFLLYFVVAKAAARALARAR